MLNRPFPDPFLHATTWHVPQPLDLRAMALACDPLIGSHDFSSFCRRPKVTEGQAPVSLTRRVTDARWTELDDGLLRFEITANVFCHQMVRSVVGLLVDVGRGDPGRRRAGHHPGPGPPGRAVPGPAPGAVPLVGGHAAGVLTASGGRGVAQFVVLRLGFGAVAGERPVHTGGQDLRLRHWLRGGEDDMTLSRPTTILAGGIRTECAVTAERDLGLRDDLFGQSLALGPSGWTG